ncbi:MAG TPA: ABC transporter ATP-binding protein [Solirubrobacter sp.]|nr:ABC transporter ATP-binding protein [Solirubrobacter sp.]
MLELDGVSKTYRIGTFGGTELHAVRDVSFTLESGEVISLIGESGSGKSTIGRMILRLLAPSAGTITLDGVDIASFDRRGLKRYYGSVQGVFQDPFSCFNPVFKVDRVFWMLHDEYFARTSRRDWHDTVVTSLAAVDLDAREILGKYPHQLSGGQLQRLLVARALMLDIDFLIADEISSMLDASTRIDVLNLLADLRDRGLGVLFITHDLSLGNYISSRTIILQRGEIVEMGPTAQVYDNPRHPYTRMLLESVPRLHERWSNFAA